MLEKLTAGLRTGAAQANRGVHELVLAEGPAKHVFLQLEGLRVPYVVQ
jgi:hypothetical protein